MAKQYSDEEILAYKDKEATSVQERFADWLIEKLELEFPNTKAEAAFREAVRLATALRMIFQASKENQDVRAEARSEREEAASAKASKGKGKAKGKPADEDEDEDEDEKPAKPAKATKATKAAKGKATPPPADEDEDDTASAPPAKKSAPKKASARSGAAAPF